MDARNYHVSSIPIVLKINNETKVGILAAVALSLFFLGFNLLKGEKIFQSGFELKSYYDNIQGLASGNPVIYNGYRVGSVKSIDMDEQDGLLEVIFSLEKGLEIPHDSRAVIASADLLGSKSIRIERGLSREPAENGGILTGEIEPTIDEVVMDKVFPITEDVDDLIKQMERFIGWMNNTMDASAGNKFDIILDEFVNTSKNFARSSYRVDTLLGSVQGTVRNTNRMIRTLGDQTETLGRVMDNTAQFTDSLAAASGSVKSIVESSASMVASVEGITRDINEGRGSLGKLVKDDQMVQDIETVIAKADSFVEKMNESGRVPIDLKLRLGKTPEEKAQARDDKKRRKLDKMREREEKRNR